MHHKTDIKPVIENHTTSFYREMKESISEHYFHILCYIFDSNFNIHKRHYLYDISSDIYSKERGEVGVGGGVGSSIVETNKTTCLSEIPSLIVAIHRMTRMRCL